MDYGISKTVNVPFEQIVETITKELKKEGFGILTSIDIQDTFKKKLDINFKRYIILGACNPTFAKRALEIDDNVGLLLPCNVIVYDKGKQTTISAFNPLSMIALMENPAIESIAQEIKVRIQRVIDAV